MFGLFDWACARARVEAAAAVRRRSRRVGIAVNSSKQAIGLALLLLPTAAAADLPKVMDLMAEAIANSKAAEEAGSRDRFEHTMVRLLEKLDSDGTVRESTELRYRVRPSDTVLEYDLLAINGKPPTEAERRADEKRRKKLQSDTGGFKFDKSLIEKYDAEMVGLQEMEGRPTYVIRYWPKEGKLPIRNRVDYVLNKSAGRIWIDEEDRALAKIDYKLQEPAKLWWGLIGSIVDMAGGVTLERVEKNIWLPKEIDVDMAGRVLFISLDQRIRLRWSDYR